MLIKNFHNSVGENQSGTESVIVWRLSGIFLRLFMSHTEFFYVDSVSEAILEVPCEIFSTFCGLIFLLLNNPMYRRDFGRFSRQINKYLLFFQFTDFYEVLDIFPRLSYRLTFIMLNVGMVDNLEFWQTIFEFQGPKHVRFPLPGFSQDRVQRKKGNFK